MKQYISKLGGALSAAIFLAGLNAPLASAQDYQIDTNAVEAPAKGAAAKKAKDVAKTADPAKSTAERKAGGPDRQFGELEGWSPGKEPPKDPKDASASSSSGGPSGRGARVSTTPGGNVGVGLGF